MRMPPATITLGAAHWDVRPLTLAQVQAIEPLLSGAAETKAGSVAAAVAILRVALGRDHPEAAASIDEVEAGAPDVAAAMTQVLRLGGFLPYGDAAAGEGVRDLSMASSIGPGCSRHRPSKAITSCAGMASISSGV